MTTKELKDRLGKVPDNLEVVIEADKGRKFIVLTAKRKEMRAGLNQKDIFWMPTGELYK